MIFRLITLLLITYSATALPFLCLGLIVGDLPPLDSLFVSISPLALFLFLICATRFVKQRNANEALRLAEQTPKPDRSMVDNGD